MVLLLSIAAFLTALCGRKYHDFGGLSIERKSIGLDNAFRDHAL